MLDSWGLLNTWMNSVATHQHCETIGMSGRITGLGYRFSDRMAHYCRWCKPTNYIDLRCRYILSICATARSWLTGWQVQTSFRRKAVSLWWQGTIPSFFPPITWWHKEKGFCPQYYRSAVSWTQGYEYDGTRELLALVSIHFVLLCHGTVKYVTCCTILYRTVQYRTYSDYHFISLLYCTVRTVFNLNLALIF